MPKMVNLPRVLCFPKIEAAIEFVESGEGRRAIITNLDNAYEAFKGHVGTQIEH